MAVGPLIIASQGCRAVSNTRIPWKIPRRNKTVSCDVEVKLKVMIKNTKMEMRGKRPSSCCGLRISVEEPLKQYGNVTDYIMYRVVCCRLLVSIVVG